MLRAGGGQAYQNATSLINGSTVGNGIYCTPHMHIAL